MIHRPPDPMNPLKILFVAAEMDPLVQVGGLGDVAGALPPALAARGHDVRVLLPAYGKDMLAGAREVARLPGRRGRIMARDELACPVWLLETSGLLRRRSRPYLNRAGQPWADNPVQFGLLGRVAADIASGDLAADWRPDVVHANDWHTGLAPVWIKLRRLATGTVFTIHNLGYPGRFPIDFLGRLGLPDHLNHPEALEFHGEIAFLKGGLAFSDRLTTVSPRYAREILSPESGCGLDGLLRARAARLSGILNGIDNRAWNPATDCHLEHPFDADNLAGKIFEKRRLMAALGLDDSHGRVPVLAWIGRLAHQKGADLFIEALETLVERPLRLAVLGSGEVAWERALHRAVRRHPGRLAVHTGFSVALARRIYAGADMLLMPSRFEPCGLAQLCAMRYGTLPVASRVGGLADTVVDPDASGTTGTGFHMASVSAAGLLETVDRALARYADEAAWQAMVAEAMRQRFDWDDSAAAYEAVYRSAMADAAKQAA